MVVMTILVKDEIDIIEANIRMHAKLGIDAFVVMDNNSTDGTREKLAELTKEYEITIIDEKGLYQQAKWMKRLAKIAKEKYNPRWIINNDADEFWIPKNFQTIPEALPKKGAVLTCHRYNMILDESIKDGNFYEAQYYVHNPVFYEKESQLNEDYPSMMITRLSPKVITDPKGLILIRGGNHKALHIRNFWDYLKRYDKIKEFKDIEVYHFPIRSYGQFKKHIKTRKALLESGKNIKMGPHYKRWVRLYNEGRLKEEWEERIVIKKHELEVFKKFGIAKKNLKVSQLIKEYFD